MADDKYAALLRELLKVSRGLVAAKRPGFEPLWLQHYSDFIRSGKRCLVVRGGRRAFKSTSAMMYSIAYLLSGPWKNQLPKGDVGIFAVIAQNIETGRYLLARIHGMLDALGVPHSATAERIIFESFDAEIHVYANNAKSFLSRTIIGVLADEVAKWKSDDSGGTTRGDEDAGLAAEVIAAIEPAMAMIDGAPLLLLSSPEGFTDYHCLRFEEGDNESQMVCHVRTWDVNKKLPEDACRERARTEADFQKHYAAEPIESKTSKPFVSGPIENALHPDFDKGVKFGRRIVCADPSSGTGGDAFVHIVAGINERANGERVICIDWIATVGGRFATRKSGSEICAALADDARKFGATLVCTDQRETLLMTSELPKHGLKVKVFPHQTQNKQEAVERLQLLLEQGLLALPSRGGMLLRKQLLAYQESSTRTGLKRYAAKGSKPGGDDVVSAVLTLMMADQAGLLEGSLQHRARPKDPKPSAGLPLQFADRGPNGIDRVSIGSDGRAYVGRRRPRRSAFDGGGF